MGGGTREPGYVPRSRGGMKDGRGTGGQRMGGLLTVGGRQNAGPHPSLEGRGTQHVLPENAGYIPQARGGARGVEGGTR